MGSKKRCLLVELSVYEDVRLRRVDCIECVWHIHHHIDLFTNVSTVSNTKLSETSVQVILTSLSISCCFVFLEVIDLTRLEVNDEILLFTLT